MNISQLEYFIKVAKSENISSAAKSLYITQPTLSRAIAELEREVGTPLFDRVGGRVHLNDKGRVFLEYVEQSFTYLNSGLSAARDMAVSEAGNISVAAVSSIGFLPKLIRDFSTENPDVRVTCQICNGLTAANSTIERSADFGIVTKEVNDSRCESVVLTRSPVYVLISGMNPLSVRESISLLDLKNTQFLWNPFATSRMMTYDICSRAGFTPDIAVESNDQVLNEMLLERLPLAYLLPKTEVDCRADVYRYSNSRSIPLEEHFTIPITLCWLKKRHFSNAMEVFYNYIIQYSKHC